jgi:hypothetical protein
MNKKILNTHEFVILENNKYIINRNSRKKVLNQCNVLKHLYYVTGDKGPHPESIKNVIPKHSLLKILYHSEMSINLNTKTTYV